MELEKYICVMMEQDADALKRLLAMGTKKCNKAWVMGCIMKRLNNFYNDYQDCVKA